MSESIRYEQPPLARAISAAGLLAACASGSIDLLDAVLTGMVAAGQGFQAICLYLGLSDAGLREHLVRLGVGRPQDRPVRAGGRNPWKPEEITSLIAWRVSSVHPETIGLRLGRTPGAVRSKARRLGLPRPARNTLRKVDPQSLQYSLPGLCLAMPPVQPTTSLCGRSEGAAVPARPQPARERRSQGTAPAEQRKLPFTAIKNGTAAGILLPAPAIPRTEAEVDLSGDLTWIGAISKPQQNRLAVWAIGMLYMGGLYYKEIAARIGKTPAAVRTLRTRCGVPVCPTRKNTTRRVFDEELARASCARSGYLVKQCLETRVWFWEQIVNKGCNSAPMVRRKHGIRDTQIEGKSPMFTALSREDLKSVPPAAFLPFAHRPSTMRAG